MSRGGKAALAAAALLLLAMAGGGAMLLRRGYSARERPSAWEEALARRLRHFATPAHARSTSNPVRLTPEVMAEARAHFADHCALCHANDGSGETPIGQGLYPRAPDMRERATQQLSDGELFYIIRNGIRFTGMPGLAPGPEQEDTESWGLVHFIRHLPRIGEDELAEMRRMNPRTLEELERQREEEAFLRGEEPPPASPGPHH